MQMISIEFILKFLAPIFSILSLIFLIIISDFWNILLLNYNIFLTIADLLAIFSFFIFIILYYKANYNIKRKKVTIDRWFISFPKIFLILIILIIFTLLFLFIGVWINFKFLGISIIIIGLNFIKQLIDILF